MILLAGLLLLLTHAATEVRYFPSILYGHILVGSGMSRYDTTFTATAKKDTRVSIALFTDKGEPMKANFMDERGNIAKTGATFEFLLTGERPLKIKLQLTSEDSKDTVVVRTGWATFHSTETIDVNAIVRITTPDGKLITRHLLASEKPPIG